MELHHLRGYAVAEVALQMGRSDGAVGAPARPGAEETPRTAPGDRVGVNRGHHAGGCLRTRRATRAVVFACLQAIERGRPLDRRDVLARHPEFADELAEVFAERAELHELAAAAARGRAGGTAPVDHRPGFDGGCGLPAHLAPARARAGPSATTSCSP